MALKQLLAVLAIVTAASGKPLTSPHITSYHHRANALLISIAQTGCSVSGTATIQNQGDATAIASCSTFTGSLAVATGTTDNINIASVRAVTGDVVVQDAPNITQFGADSMQQIGGSFILNNCQILSSLTFPLLTSVGKLDFEALPNLQQLGFTASIGEATTVNIQNTFLTTLNGINLQKVSSVTIVNNPLLQAVSMQVSNVSQSLTIASNGNRLQASFPNLETAQNLTFRDSQSVSIPSLANVTGSLGFYENTFPSINTPNLTFVGGTLAFVSNSQLTNISMPNLKTIGGGFQVQNNSVLDDLSNSFGSLQSIGGALAFFGNFTR